jgi:hypothetical protein
MAKLTIWVLYKGAKDFEPFFIPNEKFPFTNETLRRWADEWTNNGEHYFSASLTKPRFYYWERGELRSNA